MVKRSKTSFFCRGSRGFVFEELCAAGASPRWGHRDEKREYGPMVKRSKTSFFCRGSRGFVFEELCAAGASPRWGHRDEKREYGPMVKRSKTSPFHGGNPGSSPGGVTKQVKGEPVSIRRRVRFYRVFQNIEKRRGLRRKLPPRFCGHIPLLPLCRTRHFPDRVHRRRRRAGRICRGPRKKRRVLGRAGEGAKKAGASVYFCRGVWYSGGEISRRRYRREEPGCGRGGKGSCSVSGS